MGIRFGCPGYLEKAWMDSTFGENASTTTREISRAFKESEMSYAAIEMKIIQWSEARKIIPNSTPEVQLLKAMSEMGELADATIKGDKEAVVDSVGDVMVCLINYCALQDIHLVDCMEVAYDQIKNRRGTLLPNGVFRKTFDHL
jgi:NTP pyrophosphatase (non-canonical NTP hydrolase)